jgi:hypothetical protein
MDAATWLTISIIGYSLAGVLLVVAIFMFIKMNIPAIIGDLSGRTAARKIREIREHNKGSDNKRPQPKAFRLDRESKRLGRTGGIGKTGRTGKTGPAVEETQLIGPAALSTELLKTEGSEPTVLLSQTDATVLLSDETETLSDETTLLDATVLLEHEDELSHSAFMFEVVKDIKIVHTNEVI